MKKRTLKLNEVLILKRELELILQESLSFTLKFWLNKLQKKVNDEFTEFDTLKNQLIMKFGVKADDESYSISEKDPNYAEFNKEIIELLNSEIELEYKELSLSSFESLNTTSNFPVLFYLIDDES